jgi:hypothetical protein
VRGLLGLAVALLALGCAATAPHPSTRPDPVTGERRPMPATIPCDSPVVVNAANSARGVQAERRWISKYYPGWTDYRQSLQSREDRVYDILTFKDREGRDTSICFDITSWFGRW